MDDPLLVVVDANVGSRIPSKQRGSLLLLGAARSRIAAGVRGGVARPRLPGNRPGWARDVKAAGRLIPAARKSWAARVRSSARLPARLAATSRRLPRYSREASRPA